jgi:hypothetical protein
MKWQAGKKEFIELTEDNVIINTVPINMSGGAVSMMFSAMTSSMKTVTIPYDQISSVSITAGGWTSSPFIQILSGGERAITSDTEAQNNPSCVVFSKKDMKDASELKEEIERRVSASKSKNRGGPSSDADELMKFAELLKSGLISQEEFDAKKRKILGS